MSEEFRHIVRILGKDIDGTESIEYGLVKIKGIGKPLSELIIEISGLKKLQRIGNLTDPDIQKVESIIKDPMKYGIPFWLLNRRKDLETGKDSHLIGADLEFRVKSDIDLAKKIHSWKGVRHSLGLKVRGQRTGTMSKKKGKVKVMKKNI